MAISNGITNPVAGIGVANTLKVLGGAIAVGTAGLALNAVTPAIRVPAGFTVFGAIISSTDVDTNASPTILFGLGDTGSTSRLIAASNVGQAGTANQAALAPAAIGYRYPVETTVNLIASTAAATAAAGTVTVYLLGVCD
jgi:hypothetical protein